MVYAHLKNYRRKPRTKRLVRRKKVSYAKKVKRAKPSRMLASKIKKVLYKAAEHKIGVTGIKANEYLLLSAHISNLTAIADLTGINTLNGNMFEKDAFKSATGVEVIDGFEGYVTRVKFRMMIDT